MLPEQYSIVVALVCFGAMFLISLSSKRNGVGGVLLTAMASAFLLAGIIIRWDRLGQGPFLTLFEVLLSNLFSLSLVFAVLYAGVKRVRVATPVVMVLLMVLSVWALRSRPDLMPLPPTFDHPWLWIHVIAGKLFLSLCMTAFSLAMVLLMNRTWGFATDRVSAEEHDPMVWRLLAAAFVFHSFMLIAGAVWAHDAWGRYWSWDPLETWSLLTWLCLAIVLHLRLTYRIPPPLGWMLAVFVFVIAFLTFFGVQFFSLAPHKGVM